MSPAARQAGGLLGTAAIIAWLILSGCSPSRAQLRDRAEDALAGYQQLHYLACLDGLEPALPPEECERHMSRLQRLEGAARLDAAARSAALRRLWVRARPYAEQLAQVAWARTLEWLRSAGRPASSHPDPTPAGSAERLHSRGRHKRPPWCKLGLGESVAWERLQLAPVGGGWPRRERI